MSTPAMDARRFGVACLLGLLLGLYYSFLRPLRPRHTAISDLLFLPAAFYCWLYLGFAVCNGDIRLSYSIGLLVGALVFQWIAGEWIRRFFQGVWHVLDKIFLFIPRYLKKFLKKPQKIANFLFPSGKK